MYESQILLHEQMDACPAFQSINLKIEIACYYNSNLDIVSLLPERLNLKQLFLIRNIFGAS